MKQLLKKILDNRGWFLRKNNGLPFGVNLRSDIERLGGTKNIHTAYDVGAHHGLISRCLAEMFSNTMVYSFEPVSTTYKVLKERTADNSRITAFNYALGNTDSEVSILLKEDSEWNSLKPDLNKKTDSNLLQETIRVRKLDEVAHENNHRHIDFLKVDTEGFEIEVLSGARKYLEENRISFIFAEASLRKDDTQHTYLPDLIDFLNSYQISLIALYDQNVFEGKYSGFFNALFMHKNGLKAIG